MTRAAPGLAKPENRFGRVFLGVLALLWSMQDVYAQDSFATRYSELARLFNGFDMAQSRLLQQIVSIGENPSLEQSRLDLQRHLLFMRRMSMEEMMAMGLGHGSDGEDMHDGLDQTLETAGRIELLRIMRAAYSAEEVQSAFVHSGVIDGHAAAVILRGRQFENRLFEIYSDDTIERKDRAVDAAVGEYLSDNANSVPALPKSYSLMSSHEYAGAFRIAFPRLSGLLWSSQWLQLAALEGLMVEYVDDQFSHTIEDVMQRFWNKVGTDSGMSMFPAPVELPMAPTIAPHLYLFHPQAAVILDNLNMLETVIADILAWPNLSDRQTAIGEAVAEFTGKEGNFAADYDYLLTALRGGIYNQGGPAIGELERSERNRSRTDMQMRHNISMRPLPQ